MARWLRATTPIAPRSRATGDSSRSSPTPLTCRGSSPPDSQQFLRDTKAGTLILISRSNNAGQPANGSALYGQPSFDGRFVTFQASATNLPGGSAEYTQAYVRDRERQRTLLLSRAADGEPGNDTSSDVAISGDGHWASFDGNPTNLGGNPAYYSVFRAGPIP